MLIGKRGAASSAISTADFERVTVRGRDLAADLMGSTSFTEFFFFLATGRMPSASSASFSISRWSRSPSTASRRACRRRA